MMKRILFIITCLVIMFGISGCVKSSSGAAYTMLEPQQMKEDLDYLYNAIVVTHPKMAEQGFKDKYDKLYKTLYVKIKKPMHADEFLFIAKEAVMPFNDGHTLVDYPVDSKIRVIPLNFSWLNDGMIVTYNSDLLKKGDKIISIGNKGPEKILKEMKKVISSENDEWVKFCSQYELIFDIYLNKLGLINKDNVLVKVEHIDGSVETIKLPFMSFTSKWAQEVKPYSYELKKSSNLAIFHLNQCLNDDGYKKMLKDFFSEVQSNNISKVVVDLRQNSGGDSRVMDEFLKYIKIDNYIGFTDRRYSKISSKVSVSHGDNNLYNGKIYVITSNKTFSSANLFAVIFKYNKIGTIVGEPTGNAPNHYGQPKRFTLPNSKLSGGISQNDWLSPYINDYSNTLEPDVHIPMTRKDIVAGSDPCIDWIIKN